MVDYITMSDSSLSEPVPDDTVLEQELRQIVRQIYKAGNLEELTVKRVRTAAEKNLGLDDGFFKESQWKDKSKAIIENEAVCATLCYYSSMILILDNLECSRRCDKFQSRTLASQATTESLQGFGQSTKEAISRGCQT